jgi:GNAT superfamily N-acetyltransferase
MTRPTIRPATRSDMPAVAALFGAKGACAGCWCMYWGRLKADWDSGRGDANRRALEKEMRAGHTHAVLAFAGDETVGWCRVGPRDGFPRLGKSRKLKRAQSPEATWSVVCFFVRRDWRGKGVGRSLLEAAAAHAFAQGAAVVEGYPVRPATSAKRLPDVFAWTGTRSLFETAGFRPAADSVDAGRPVYVRTAPGLRRQSPGPRLHP